MVSSRIPGADRKLLMSGKEFIEVSPRLVHMISVYYPGPERHALAAAYDTHFSNLVKRPDFWDRINVIMAYDVALQRRHLQMVFNPAEFQHAIWNSVWAESLKRLLPLMARAALPPKSRFVISTLLACLEATAHVPFDTKDLPALQRQDSSALATLDIGIPGTANLTLVTLALNSLVVTIPFTGSSVCLRKSRALVLCLSRHQTSLGPQKL